MPTPVTLSALGESVTEATVTRWLKQVGDTVAVDEPLIEVSTDKVDTEIASPYAGVLLEINAAEDEIVEVGAQLCVIGAGGETGGDAAGPDAPAAEGDPVPEASAVEPSRELATPTEHALAAPAAPAQLAATQLATSRGGCTSVILPALGESVTEGTVTRWLESVGDDVAVDEPLLEVSTDKVDTEIPSPVGGTLLEIMANEDETVEVGAELALIGRAGPSHVADSVAAPSEDAHPQGTPTREAASVESAPPTERPGQLRITEAPVPPLSLAPATTAPGVTPTTTPATATPPAPPKTPAVAASNSPMRGHTEPLSRLRRVIATRMVESLQASAQLTQVMEVDMTGVARLREGAKADFRAREGVKLTYLPFFAKAAIDALKQHPKLNAAINTEAGTVTYLDHENIAFAVDTEKGLLAPVVKDAGNLSIAGLAKKIADLAERTRANTITADDLTGGTFTITNLGSFGALFDTPIINQPQVAILGPGAVVKRPVVIDDPTLGETIAVRHVVNLALTYDHRLVDGADAGRFLSDVKSRLEAAQFEV